MSKSDRVPDPDRPWSFPVLVTQLPEAGQHVVLETSPEQRAMIAVAAGVNAVLEASAAFDLVPEARGLVNVSGTVRARVEQDCVVTLDPVENSITELVSVVFAPPSEIPASAKSAPPEDGSDDEIAELPEPIVNGVIDLGQLATEFLVLGIDPYPRKPGAVFTPPAPPDDPDEHPFAALKALKAAPGKPGKDAAARKAKDKKNGGK